MRTIVIASAGIALVSGGGAIAQTRPGASYGIPGRAPMSAPSRQPYQAPVARPIPAAPRPAMHPTMVQPIAVRPTPMQQTPMHPTAMRGSRWGSKIGGRWWAGANAPGGWAGYRRPHRGWAVPTYWNAPRFYVSDWSNYGLPQPPYGYNWARYYDDAVLIDTRGSVYDNVNAVDWDRTGGRIDTRDLGDGDASNDQMYAGSDDRGYDDRYPEAPRRDDGRDHDRDNGLGGAAIGGVVGGVAGNVIAGRGNRLGGTLIGAGVGAAAGYAIDKSEDHGRRMPPPNSHGYGAGYAQPGYGGGYPQGSAYPPAPAYATAPGSVWTSPDGVTTITTTAGGAYPAGSTTIVVQSAPVVTTTTTEYYEERPRTRTVWRNRVARPTKLYRR